MALPMWVQHGTLLQIPHESLMGCPCRTHINTHLGPMWVLYFLLAGKLQLVLTEYEKLPWLRSEMQSYSKCFALKPCMVTSHFNYCFIPILSTPFLRVIPILPTFYCTAHQRRAYCGYFVTVSVCRKRRNLSVHIFLKTYDDCIK